MIDLIKSDIRKLLTIRSTYFLSLIGLLLAGGVSFYFEGYKGNSGSPAANLDANALQVIVFSSAGMSVIFVTIIAILLMAHEYRYNTIMYTLTSSASRTKVLLSKALTVSFYALFYGALTAAVGLGSYMVGLSLRDAVLPTQDFDLWSVFGKVIAYFIGYALVGLLIATLVRNLVGAIVFFLIIPSTIEALIGSFILKENGAYLPFRSLDNIIGISADPSASMYASQVQPATSIAVAAAYIAVTMLIAWVLFLKRDAN